MKVAVEFCYEPAISEGEIHTVSATVYLGKTGARGDDPHDVISLYVSSDRGNWVDVDDDVYQDLCEIAILEAIKEVN